MGENGSIKPKTRTDMAEEWLGQEVFVYDPSNGDEVLRMNSGAAQVMHSPVPADMFRRLGSSKAGFVEMLSR